TAGAQSPITVRALASDVANAQTQGIAVAGLLAVGASLSDATAEGSLKAYIDGEVGGSGSVTVEALGSDTAVRSSPAAPGGILGGSGRVATATVAPTIEASGDGPGLVTGGAVTVSAPDTPESTASVFGVAAGGLAVGVSTSDAAASPAVTAYAGGPGSSIT